MAKYINTKTGAVLDSPCAISGGDWVDADNIPDALAGEEKTPAKETSAPDAAPDMTKEEIMNELDALGIKYDPKTKKDDLYKLMIEA